MQRKTSSLAKAVLTVLSITLLLVTGAWAGPKYRVLYTFKGGKDGGQPLGGLIFDGSGSLYGTTAQGGKGCAPSGCGTVFKLTLDSSGKWTKTVLHYFSGSDGASPEASLVFDAKGNLYGTTYDGGQENCSGYGCGAVFELTPSSGGRWKETILHRFAGGRDGATPWAGLVFDAAGNLYGATTHGGGALCDCGTVFELSRAAGGGWSEQVLHGFSGPDGQSPFNVILDAAGNLYGVTAYDGAYGVGVAFELAPGAGGWNDTTMYNFPGSPDGALPDYGLAFEGSNLYGTTDVGGAGFGTIFELKPSSNGGRAESVIYRFAGGKDGAYPGGGLIFDKEGNLYGSTGGDLHYHAGNIFKLMPKVGGKWGLRVLYTFTDHKEGQFPGGVISDVRGNLYGIAAAGGDLQCTGGGGQGCGVVFELTP